METHDIQRVLQARYSGVEASDVLVQFARLELERPDALVLMQNGKFYEVCQRLSRKRDSLRLNPMPGATDWTLLAG